MIDKIFFWMTVLIISAFIFIPYWLFGFETGLLVAIVVVCLFLSKISSVAQEIHEDLLDMYNNISKKPLPPKAPFKDTGK